MAIDQLEQLRSDARAQLDAITTTDDLSEWHARFLGRKGALTDAMRQLGALSADERRAFGQAVNALKTELSDAFEARQELVRGAQLNERLASDAIDVTLPGRTVELGTLHPITQLVR